MFQYSGLSINAAAGGKDRDRTLEAKWATGKPSRSPAVGCGEPAHFPPSPKISPTSTTVTLARVFSKGEIGPPVRW